MKYTVFITEEHPGDLYATVAELPNCQVHAKTRKEALQAIHNSISKFIMRTEVMQIDVPGKPRSGDVQEKTPWEWFGAFNGDPTWGVLFDDIERRRATDERPA